MKLNLVYSERGNWDDLIFETVQSVLGIEAQVSFANLLTKEGVKIYWVTQYKGKPGRWVNKEPYWTGVKIVFSFASGVDHRKVHRSLLIKPDGVVDYSKLREKWAEILALKAEDDARRARKASAWQRQQNIVQTAREAINAQGNDAYKHIDVEPYTDDSVALKIRGLSVEAVAQIAAIVQKDRETKS